MFRYISCVMSFMAFNNSALAQEAGRIGAWTFFSTENGSNISTRAVAIPFCLDQRAMVQVSCVNGQMAVTLDLACINIEGKLRGLFVDEENGISFPFSMKPDGNSRFSTGPNEASKIFVDKFAASRKVEVRTGAVVAKFNFYGLDRALAKTDTCTFGYLD